MAGTRRGGTTTQPDMAQTVSTAAGSRAYPPLSVGTASSVVSSGDTNGVHHLKLRRRVVPGMGFLLAAVVLAGCLGAGTPWTGAGPRVGVVGDSQVWLIEHNSLGDNNHHMTDALVEKGYQVSTSDIIGASTRDLAKFTSFTSFAGFPDPGAQIVVTAIGVNDLRADPSRDEPLTPIDQAEANYTAYLDALGQAGVACVVLVEIPETTQESLDQIGPVWNEYLSNQASARGGVVMPWASTVAQHPEYVNTTDGIHETALGVFAYLGGIAAAVDQCAQRIAR